MKKDLDSLMQARELVAILVTGSGQHNPAMVYMTGGGHMTSADLIKPRGADPVLYYNPMEREEAAASGLKTKNLAAYNWKDFMQQADQDTNNAKALRYKAMLTELGITSGKVSVYGKGEVGANYAVFTALQTAAPDLEIIGEDARDSLFLAAMSTKDSDEIKRKFSQYFNTTIRKHSN